VGDGASRFDLTLFAAATVAGLSLVAEGRSEDVALVAVLVAETALLSAAQEAARRIPDHNDIVALARFALAADVLGHGIRGAFLAGAPRPFEGAARGAYHVETALVVGWPIALALVAWRRFGGERIPAVPVGAWVGLTVGHVLVWPLSRRQTSTLLFAVELAAVAWGGLCAFLAWPKRWTSVHGVVLFLLGAEVVVATLGPFLTDVFRDWSVARILYAYTFSGLAAWYLWRMFRASLDR
jgi:hypothetical protein